MSRWRREVRRFLEADTLVVGREQIEITGLISTSSHSVVVRLGNSGLCAKLCADPRLLEHEARILDGLNSSRITPLVQSYAESTPPYIVMKELEFEDIIPSRGMPGHGRTVAIWARDVALALQEVHAQGVLHLDVKPHNVLCDEGRRVLVDFGLARRLDSVAPPEKTVFGTAEYQSPEHWHGHGFSVDSDLYSLAASAYALLQGFGPLAHDAPSAETLRERALAGNHMPQPLVGFPSALQELLFALLRVSDSDARRSAGDVADSLDDILRRYDTLPLVAQPLPPAEPASNTQSRTSRPFAMRWTLMGTGILMAATLTAAWSVGRGGVQSLDSVRPPERSEDLKPENPVPVELSLGTDFACVRADDGQLDCLGASDLTGGLPNDASLLGGGAGHQHICVLDDDQKVVCSPPDRPGRAVSHGIPDRPQAWVSAGNFTTCSLGTDATVTCWPVTDELSKVDSLCQPLVARTPRPLGGKRSKQVEVGWCLACSQHFDDTISCWTSERPEPVSMFGGKGMVTFDVGSDVVCATTNDGRVRCADPRRPMEEWEPRASGSLTETNYIVQVTVGDIHGCKRDRSGRVDCWQWKPKETGGADLDAWLAGRQFKQVHASGTSTCGITTQGQVDCFGTLADVAREYNCGVLNIQDACDGTPQD